MRRLTCLIFCCLLGYLLADDGLQARERQSSRLAEPASAILDQSTYINSDRVLSMVGNVGVYGYDPGGHFGYGYGMFYPFTSISAIEIGHNVTSPLYSAGIWIAGRVNGEVRATIADYKSEFTPGPEIASTYPSDALSNPAYRCYKLYSDSGSSNPNVDYSQWPVHLGAPITGSGTPVIKGTQSTWSVCTDFDASRHTIDIGSTAPLGIEIQQYTWLTTAGSHDQSVFVRYLLYNRGSNTIDSCFVGLFADPDIGGAGDDLVASNELANFMYAYNSDYGDQWYGAYPPAIGMQLLLGPLVPAQYATGTFRENNMVGMRNLGAFAMTAFANWSSVSFPESASETFNVLKGLTPAGNAKVNPVTGDTTRYDFTGSPITMTGWRDPAPGDKGMLISTGPFTFAPGDSQIVYLRVAVSLGGTRYASIPDLGVRLRDVPSLMIDPERQPTDIDPDDRGEDLDLPADFSLSPNYPNPFNATTHFSFSLARATDVKVDILNAAGQVVNVLLIGQRPAGTENVTWNADNQSGETVASGVYFYRLQAGEQVMTRKMVLAR